MSKKITQRGYDEAKALVGSEDLDLTERRTTFAKIKGRVTTLNDDKLMVAAMTEEPDDEEFVAAVEQIEREGYEIVAEEAATTE